MSQEKKIFKSKEEVLESVENGINEAFSNLWVRIPDHTNEVNETIKQLWAIKEVMLLAIKSLK